jgi:hypothetical protein
VFYMCHPFGLFFLNQLSWVYTQAIIFRPSGAEIHSKDHSGILMSSSSPSYTLCPARDRPGRSSVRGGLTGM